MSMQKQEFIPGGWKSEYDPDLVEHSMEGKKIILEDRIDKGRLTTPKAPKAP